MSKTLDKIALDPRVAEVSNEVSDGNGYWVYLNAGHCTDQKGQHTIHEYTIKSVLREMAYNIDSCDCSDCVQELSVTKEN